MTSSNFQVTNCDLTKKTATVAFTTNLRNGKCESVSLSWITLAAFYNGKLPTDVCIKSEQGSATISGGVTTLTNVPCDSTLSVYAHDGSFKGSVGSLAGILPKRCRNNSGNSYCGPYGQLKLNCGECKVETMPSMSVSAAITGGRRLSSYKK